MAPVRTSKIQLPKLDDGPIPLHHIREQARLSLLDIIDSRRGGRKALFLDPALSGPLTCLDLNITQLLAEHGVTRLHYLDDRPLTDPAFNPPGAEDRVLDVRTVLWLIHASPTTAQQVAAQIKSLRRAAKASQVTQQDFCVCFVPRRTVTCNRVLEEEGVLGDISILELPIDLLPVEDDVLSLELEGAFKECVLEGDSSSLYAMSRAVMRLQAMWGLIPRLQGKGPAAVAVRDMVLRMRRENPGLVPPPPEPDSGRPHISRAVLIDREVDLVTPCMTQTTFEGLIDEVTGIATGGAVPWAPKDKRTEAAIGGTTTLLTSAGSAAQQHLQSAAAGGGSSSAAGPAPGTLTTLLNSSDPYYKEFRDLPYHLAIARLQSAARDGRREYEGLVQKDITQLKTFVKGLPKLMLLDRLTDVATPVAEQIRQQSFHTRLRHEMDAVEGMDLDAGIIFCQELMYRGSGMLDVLRLLVLLCITTGGLPKRALDMLRDDFLVAYGFEHALTFAALEKSGLIFVSGSGRPPFSAIRKAFKLIVHEPDGTPPDAPPTDVSYFYRGYAPLSVRLVETAVGAAGWGKPGSTTHEALLLLPGASFDTRQATVLGEPGSKQQTAVQHSESASAQQAPASRSAGVSSSGAEAGAADGVKARGGPDGAGSSAAGTGNQEEPEVVLVVFLGGVTYTEISALRWLSSRTRFKYLILTSQIVNGRALFSSFMDPAACKATGFLSTTAAAPGIRLPS